MYQNPWLLSLGALLLVAFVVWEGKSLWKQRAEAVSLAPGGVAASGEGDGLRNDLLLASLPGGAPAQSAAVRAAEEEAARRVERERKLRDTVKPFLATYCADCHGPESLEAGINVEQLQSVDQYLTEHKTWERVYRMINSGAMPPSDVEPQPSMEEQQSVANLLYEELYNFDCDLIDNPGRPTVQRLNRTEYNNTIRDLLGITLTPADDFPADDVGDGFDNIGDVLSLPPLLMEKYLAAAEQIAAAVIDTTDYSKPLTLKLGADQLKSTSGGAASGSFLWLSTNGEILGTFAVPATGDYEIRIAAQAQQMGDEKARFAVSVDGKRIKEYAVQSNRSKEDFSQPIRLEAGKVDIGAAFLNDAYNPAKKEDRNFAVGSIALHGPLGGGQPVRSAAHSRFVTALPLAGQTVQDAARQVLQPILFKAFRRPVSDDEVNRYAELVGHAVEQMGETYEGGLALALQAILVSPDFLFRLEQDPLPGQSERALNDFELASRLSYFLWSSMPDDELFRLATEGQLKTPSVLKDQVRRMLQDEKSEALVSNFAAQWLNLRNLDGITPNPDVFKDFEPALKADMRQETELLFRAVMREDRSVEDLLSADFTFVNRRLAAHYGIDGVSGDEFQRVSLKETNRSGVLTHASILTLTSNPGRTSPVKRGKWIMENIFGEAPPPPPPGVPELEVTAEASPGATLREQLAKHREDPGCAACHNAMDPLGLGFENFDAIGRWRDTDQGKPVDASGSLPSGEAFRGAVQLIGIIRNKKDRFFRTMAERMLVYAIGRGIEYYDKCAVDQCLLLLSGSDNRFSALVEGIVLSDPFLNRAAAVSSSVTAK